MRADDQTLVANLELTASALDKHYNAPSKERARLMRQAARRIRELSK